MSLFISKHPKTNESGNVLWFILIAIIFIGLLTMVLTRSSSTVEQTGNIEQSSIKVGQVFRYAKAIEAAIEEMKLRGTSESDVSFENSVTTIDYTNTNCTSNDCRLFHVEGSGLTYRDPPTGVNDGSEWIFTAANNVGTIANAIGTTVGRTGNDVVMLMPNATPGFCAVVNRQMGISTAGDIPDDETGIVTTEFTGVYPNALNIIDGDPTPFELDGHVAGCVTDTDAAPDITYFYYVVLAR